MTMLLQGISMMCNKGNRGLMRETLNSFVAQYQDEIRDGGSESRDLDSVEGDARQ